MNSEGLEGPLVTEECEMVPTTRAALDADRCKLQESQRGIKNQKMWNSWGSSWVVVELEVRLRKISKCDSGQRLDFVLLEKRKKDYWLVKLLK